MFKLSEFIEKLSSIQEVKTLTNINILYKDNKNQWQHFGRDLQVDHENKSSEIKYIHFSALKDDQRIESKLTYIISKNVYLIENLSGTISEVKGEDLYDSFKNSITSQLT